MDPTVKSLWLEALRSGKYQQGPVYGNASHLRDSRDQGYCCLGVLCDVVAPDRWARLYEGGMWSHNQMQGLPSDEVLGSIPLAAAQRLASMNDGRDFKTNTRQARNSFAEIADWIEANL